MDILATVCTGIISGIFASVFFTLIMFAIKPKVKISDKICIETTKEGEAVYRIKIVNHTFAMLTNLRYSLHFCEMHGDGICTVTEIKPRKTPLMSMVRYNIFKDNTDYAVRISYDIDEKRFPLGEQCKLTFTFIADHSFSNTTTCVVKEYYKDDILTGVFESDKSVKIIRSF